MHQVDFRTPQSYSEFALTSWLLIRHAAALAQVRGSPIVAISVTTSTLRSVRTNTPIWPVDGLGVQ